MSERRNTFKDGADFYAKEIGAFVGGEHTRLANADYLKNVQQEIDNLKGWSQKPGILIHST